MHYLAGLSRGPGLLFLMTCPTVNTTTTTTYTTTAAAATAAGVLTRPRDVQRWAQCTNIGILACSPTQPLTHPRDVQRQAQCTRGRLARGDLGCWTTRRLQPLGAALCSS